MYKLLFSTALLLAVSCSTKDVEEQPLTLEEQKAQEEIERTGKYVYDNCFPKQDSIKTNSK